MNPYEPPSLAAQAESPAPIGVEPFTSVLSLFGRALSVYFGNLATIAPITLLVFAPVQIIKNYLVHAANIQDDLSAMMRIEMMIESAFGSLVTASLIIALSHKIRTGRDLGTLEALSKGVKRWGKVFAARFVTGILVVVGLILLIIPGIIWSVRYSLVDEVAALEVQPSAERVMNRSRQLVQGHGWKVFGVGLLATVAVFAFNFVAGMVSGLANEWILWAVMDCVIDVTYRFFAVVMLLVYLGVGAESGEAP